MDHSLLLRRFPNGGVILRASGIYGSRDVGSMTLPLGALMQPMEMVSAKTKIPDSNESTYATVLLCCWLIAICFIEFTSYVSVMWCFVQSCLVVVSTYLGRQQDVGHCSKCALV